MNALLYQSMTPEEQDNEKNSQSPENASIENPLHVSGHPPHTVYPNIPKNSSHHETSSATAAPTIPISKTWLCKNRCTGNWNAKLKCSGMNHSDTIPDCSATSSGCPSAFRIGVAKTCRTYKEAEIEADDDGVRNGDGGELHLAQMPGEGLGHDVHGERRHAAEDGGAHYVPQLFRFDPDPRVQVPISLLIIIIVISAPINNVVGKRIRRRFRQQQRPSNFTLVGFHFS
nr:hypothetical protein DY000_00015351 [Ipomoea batatas]